MKSTSCFELCAILKHHLIGINNSQATIKNVIPISSLTNCVFQTNIYNISVSKTSFVYMFSLFFMLSGRVLSWYSMASSAFSCLVMILSLREMHLFCCFWFKWAVLSGTRPLKCLWQILNLPKRCCQSRNTLFGLLLFDNVCVRLETLMFRRRFLDVWIYFNNTWIVCFPFHNGRTFVEQTLEPLFSSMLHPPFFSFNPSHLEPFYSENFEPSFSLLPKDCHTI